MQFLKKIEFLSGKGPFDERMPITGFIVHPVREVKDNSEEPDEIRMEKCDAADAHGYGVYAKCMMDITVPDIEREYWVADLETKEQADQFKDMLELMVKLYQKETAPAVPSSSKDVLIQVQGGLVKSIHANTPDINYIVVDWDNLKESHEEFMLDTGTCTYIPTFLWLYPEQKEQGTHEHVITLNLQDYYLHRPETKMQTIDVLLHIQEGSIVNAWSNCPNVRYLLADQDKFEGEPDEFTIWSDDVTHLADLTTAFETEFDVLDEQTVEMTRGLLKFYGVEREPKNVDPYRECNYEITHRVNDEIISVRRLEDDAVFTVGDSTPSGDIEQLVIDDHALGGLCAKMSNGASSAISVIIPKKG